MNDSETATVDQFTINKPISDSEFDLRLNSGAIFQDTTILSILYPDGTQRPLKEGEFNGKNFDALLKSGQESK
jgi:hypothetical protein